MNGALLTFLVMTGKTEGAVSSDKAVAPTKLEKILWFDGNSEWSSFFILVLGIIALAAWLNVFADGVDSKRGKLTLCLAMLSSIWLMALLS